MILIIIFIVLLIGLGSFYLYVTKVERQSFISKILGIYAKWTSHRTFPDNKAKFTQLMKEKSIENEEPYVLSEKIKNEYGIVKEKFDGMDTYIIKGENGRREKQILYLHGGGYVFQPEEYHWNWLGRLTKNIDATITVPIYPKTPNHHYQEAFDKVLAIYQKMLTKTDPDKIVFIGDSAGGGFSLALAQLLKEKGLPQPGNNILLYPWLDITMTNPKIKEFEDKALLSQYGLIQMGKSWAGVTDPSNFMLSPINGEIKGLGKISLFIGEYDLFTPDARKFRDMAEREGVTINYFEYSKMLHLFVMFLIPEGKDATKRIINIIGKN